MDLEFNVKPIVFQDQFDLGTVRVSTRGLEAQVPQYGLLKLTPMEKTLLIVRQEKGRKKIKL